MTEQRHPDQKLSRYSLTTIQIELELLLRQYLIRKSLLYFSTSPYIYIFFINLSNSHQFIYLSLYTQINSIDIFISYQLQKFINNQKLKKFKFMSRINQQLLRKRSQHNQGRLTTLQQISLHQQQIIKIQNFDVLCRHLKILYLQNNIIQKMENLNKLKQLQYLNMALNNISKIQNIQGCQSLRKLDMTVNFVEVMELKDSVTCLSKLPNIRELYMTGNPCQEWKGCKDYVIANVDTLQCYNGQVITPSQRIKAKQLLPVLQKSLFQAIQIRKLQLKKRQLEQQQRKEAEKYMTQEQKNQMKTGYTKQARKQMYEKMYDDKLRKEKDRNPQKFVQQKLSAMYNEKGQIRQCNEGRFKYQLKEYEDPDYTIFSVNVPQHLETSELIVNINPNWVSVRVKKQLVQLKLTQQILVEESKTERSKLTGQLVIKMKKLQPHQFLRSLKDKQKLKAKKQQEQKKKIQQQQKAKTLRLCEQYERKMQKQEDEIPDLE